MLWGQIDLQCPNFWISGPVGQKKRRRRRIFFGFRGLGENFTGELRFSLFPLLREIKLLLYKFNYVHVRLTSHRAEDAQLRQA